MRDDQTTYWNQHRFLILIIGTIIISIIMVVISLVIYNVSGSAQLDLSRPGLSTVSNQVERTPNGDDFSSTGIVSNDTLDDFLKKYDEQAARAKAVDAFNGDPLNPELLEFTDLASQ